MPETDLKVLILEKIRQIVQTSAKKVPLPAEILLLKWEASGKSLTLKIDLHGEVRLVTQEISTYEFNRTWTCLLEIELEKCILSIMNRKSTVDLQADLARLSA
jgi:hypothetical protein